MQVIAIDHSRPDIYRLPRAINSLVRSIVHSASGHRWNQAVIFTFFFLLEIEIIALSYYLYLRLFFQRNFQKEGYHFG